MFLTGHISLEKYPGGTWDPSTTSSTGILFQGQDLSKPGLIGSYKLGHNDFWVVYKFQESPHLISHWISQQLINLEFNPLTSQSLSKSFCFSLSVFISLSLYLFYWHERVAFQLVGRLATTLVATKNNVIFSSFFSLFFFFPVVYFSHRRNGWIKKLIVPRVK